MKLPKITNNKKTCCAIYIFLTLLLCLVAVTTLCFFNNHKKQKLQKNNEHNSTQTETIIQADTDSFKQTIENTSRETTAVEPPILTPETVETTKLEETTKTPESTEVSHSHSYYGKIVIATCTENGYTLNICNCGHSYISDETTKLGHIYTNWYVVKEATTTEAGLKECKCDRCGGAAITEEIPKKSTSVSSYIDSRITVRKVFGQMVYEYGTCSLYNRRTWGNVLSISILANGGLHVSYDNKNGEIIEFDISPLSGYESTAVIEDNGNYSTSFVGAFS